jgi:glycosyltransferase involved in cell wall biosynthesis
VPQHFIDLHHDLQGLQCGVSEAVITTSRAEQAHYRGLFGSSVPEDVMIPNGIDISTPTAEAVLRWRSMVAPEGTVALFLGGRLGDYVKGGDRACAFAAALKKMGLPVRLIGTDLRASETDPKIAEAVHGLGRLSDEDFVAVLKAVDIVLCPSRYEAFGLLAAEASALGTSVIASAIGGHLDTVSALGGMLVDNQDWSEPRKEVVDFVAMHVGRWALRSNLELPGEFTATGAVDRVEALYSAVIEKGSSYQCLESQF